MNFSERATSYYRTAKKPRAIDWIVAVILLAAIIVSLVLILQKDEGARVELYYKGEKIAQYSLSDSRDIPFDREGHALIRIENNSVYIVENDCPNQICVRTGAIRYAGQRIVCAPHKLTVLIVGMQDVDAVI
ncbi:MAG TPA: NusG domain II-containing protein [Candidatus Stercoripulliclostridium merdipullorum]|uniref:NusG domain II-containing protein n=1 Tax=Candidatus Stercoripulliclostridium merdipullorum TaxID=2840952 RepID=A0A9D1NDK8_9FIRM|nr:NusG domain II-containing protein [Candidatus Stercoripulliclostridium merdipullorum]